MSAIDIIYNFTHISPLILRNLFLYDAVSILRHQKNCVDLTFIPLLPFQSLAMFAGVEVLNEYHGSNRQNGQNLSLPEIQVSDKDFQIILLKNHVRFFSKCGNF